MGKPQSVTIAATEQSFINGASAIEYLHANKVFSYEGIKNLALDTGTGNAINRTIVLADGYVGVVAGGKDLSADSLFTSTDYKGAVPTSND
ncbi:hypothetical protein [Bacteroides heparinolyticus]|uniref:hypothetical protein n=1 Tax=Prevotella heparinolytica TaxID=28113 RepID=UPI00359FE657